MVFPRMVRLLRRQGGFTLTELVVLVAVIGILAAVGVPRLGSSIEQYQLDVAARQLEADLRWMQQLTVNLDYSDSSQAFPRFAPVTNKPYGYYIAIGTQVVRRVNLSEQVRIYPLSTQAATFSFSQDGFPAGTLGASIMITNNSGASRTIKLDDAGRIRISNP